MAYLGTPITFSVVSGLDSTIKAFMSSMLIFCACQYYAGRHLMGLLGKSQAYSLAPGFIWTIIICAIISLSQSLLLAIYIFDGIINSFDYKPQYIYWSFSLMALASAAFICLTNWFYAKRVTDDIDKLKE